jgi:cyanide hydratase
LIQSAYILCPSLHRFDIEAATSKTCDFITEAGANGAKLIAFPELWIPGYPNYIHAKTAKENFPYNLKYYRNSVDIESKHMERIRMAARAAQIMVVIGISERHRGSLYMAQTFIGPDGGILLHRRKFKPTAQERILFGDAVSLSRTIAFTITISWSCSLICSPRSSVKCA